MNAKETTKKTALSGILAALLIGAKWALLPLPNIEIITLVLASAAFAFGPFVSLLAAAAFVSEEVFIFGFGTWAIAYIFYWPLVAAVFSLLGTLVKNRPAKNTRPEIGPGRADSGLSAKKCGYLRLTVTATAAAVILTTFFGVLTSVIDVGLFTGGTGNFWQKFAVMYGRGAVFFAVHIACNLTLFSLFFTPVIKLLSDFKSKFLPASSGPGPDNNII